MEVKEMRQQSEKEKEVMRKERNQEMEEMKIKFEEIQIQREQEKEEKFDLMVKLDTMTKKIERLEAPRDLPFVVSCAHKNMVHDDFIK